MKEYTLSQLCWIREVGLFRDDAIRDMKALGISDNAIYAFCLSECFRAKDIVGIWRNYGGLYGAEFEKYFDFILQGKHFEEGWPHN
jgi:hypothetical protein